MIFLTPPLFAQNEPERTAITFSYDDWQILSNSIKSLKQNKELQDQLLMAAKEDIANANISLALTLDEIKSLRSEITIARQENTELQQHNDVAVRAQEYLKTQIDMVLERLEDRDMELVWLYEDLDEAEAKALALEKMNAQLQAQAARQWASGLVYAVGGGVFASGFTILVTNPYDGAYRDGGIMLGVGAGTWLINYYVFHKLFKWW
jgi:hypothetical protein